jgi:hypothetical protein
MTLDELKEALAADKDKAEKFKEALASDECEACGSKAEALSLAAAAVGLEISPEEVERAMAEAQELDDEELEKIGGGDATCDKAYWCGELFIPGEDEKGHDNWCVAAWHCFDVFLHTEATKHDEACFADYICAIIYHHDF